MLEFEVLDCSRSRQFLSSASLYNELVRLSEVAQQYRGSMSWKKEGAYVCLIRTLPRKSPEWLGRRSDITELIYKQFTTEKFETEERLKLLRKKYAEAERLNKTLRVGRAPSAVVSFFNALLREGLFTSTTLVGTEALYVFEAAAGVRIRSIVLAAASLELAKRENERLELLVSDLSHIGAVAALLHEIDGSFVHQGEPYTYANNFGFQVQLSIWRDVFEGLQMGDATTLEHVVADRNGRMAKTRTLAPELFIEYRRRQARASCDGLSSFEQLEEAEVVERLMSEGRLLPLKRRALPERGPSDDTTALRAVSRRSSQAG